MPPPANDARPRTRQLEHEVGADLVYFSGNRDIPGFGEQQLTATSMTLWGRIAAGKVLISPTLPIASGSTEVSSEFFDDSEDETSIGNFSIDFMAVNGADTTTRFEVGGGIAFPTADSDKALANGLSLVSRLWWNLWHYMPDTITLYAPFRLSARPSRFQVSVDAAAGLIVATAEDIDDGPFLVTQAAVQLGYRDDLFAFGGRLQGVLLDEDLSSDQFQAGAGPFAEITPGKGFIGLAYTTALDEPLNDDDLRFWGLRLSGGARF